MIGDIMKSLRIDKGLTQKELASKLNLSVTAISHYEAGNREPNLNIIILYAKFFNVSTDYILGLSRQKNQNLNQAKTIDFINRLLDIIRTYLNETGSDI